MLWHQLKEFVNKSVNRPHNYPVSSAEVLFIRPDLDNSHLLGGENMRKLIAWLLVVFRLRESERKIVRKR